MAPPRPKLRQSETVPAKKPPAAARRRLNQFDPETQSASAESLDTASAQAEAIRADSLRKSGISGAMLELQAQLSAEFLTPQRDPSTAAAEAAETGAVGAENSNGSYVGLIEKNGRATGAIGVVMTVRAKYAEEDIASRFVFPQSESIRGEKIRIDVRAVGTPSASQGFQSREVPALYGTSVGLANLNLVGTLGCLVATRGNDLCILSNNHVLANHNAARLGTAVVQPGIGDGSGNTVIGHLQRFHPLNLVNSGESFPNQVDAALATTSFRACIPGLHGEIPFVGSTAAAFVRMSVIKQGRTTGHTEGRVVGLNALVRVAYGTPNNPPPFGSFTDQIVLGGFGGAFSRSGDSGSLILGLVDGEFRPIGLLFSGSDDGSATWANPIDLVTEALDIDQILDPSFPIE